MRRPPAVDEVSEGISPRLDRPEGVVTLLVGQGTSAAAEVRVDWRQIAVVDMAIAAAGISLPKLNQSIRHASPILIEDVPMHDDPLALWFAILGIIQDQIIIERPNVLGAENGSSHFRKRVLQGPERDARRPQHTCFIIGCEGGRVKAAVAL